MSAMKLTTSSENTHELLDMEQLRNRHMLVRSPDMAALIRLRGALLKAIRISWSQKILLRSQHLPSQA